MANDRMDDYTCGIYLTILWDDTGKGKMGEGIKGQNPP
jgi:hypothetical protein